MVDGQDGDDAKSYQERQHRKALDLGGTLTAEHGIGLARRDFLELQRGPGFVAVMRAIKTALDPLNILNPGRVLPPVPALADGPSDAR